MRELAGGKRGGRGKRTKERTNSYHVSSLARVVVIEIGRVVCPRLQRHKAIVGGRAQAVVHAERVVGGPPERQGLLVRCRSTGEVQVHG